MVSKTKAGNILSDIKVSKDEEVFKVLARDKNFRIERIVSCGQATPEGQWLKQPHGEWVMVLKGEGRLRFKGKTDLVILKTGDYIFIPANKPHRVEWTHPSKATVWLAVHSST